MCSNRALSLCCGAPIVQVKFGMSVRGAKLADPNQAKQALMALRQKMQVHDIAACMVTNVDPHSSEYSAPHWLARQHVSGFTGSAGDVVVTLDGGGLWTDGRYFLQAEQQLAGTGLRLFKQRIVGTPTIAEWLVATLAAGDRVAVAGDSISLATYQTLSEAFAVADIALLTDIDLLADVWRDRPDRSDAGVFEFPLEFAGRSCAQKLADVRQRLAEGDAQRLLISALPDVAWLLNLRGADVPYCPLFEAYVLLDQSSCGLYVDVAKLPTDVLGRLAANQIDVHSYESIADAVAQDNRSISLCPNTTNASLAAAIGPTTQRILEPCITTAMKATKNAIERSSITAALRYDGVAMVRFAKWLEERFLEADSVVTERSAEAVLAGYRAELPHYVSQSFRTIAGFGPHGALMHYAADEASNATVGRDSFFLVDSGGQYLGGTTDITRTFCFGELSQAHKEDYTRVLQAVIRLSQTQFKQGARGCNLDIMARGVLWQAGIDYDCGTGHGVGQCLVVHEGPQGLNQRLEDVPLVPGMLMTNEPGVYRPGKYGVRIENIMVVVPAEVTEFGEFYRFDTLTLAPIQTRALLVERLSAGELGWLNRYHQRVYEELSPLLTEPDRRWLADACEPIKQP